MDYESVRDLIDKESHPLSTNLEEAYDQITFEEEPIKNPNDGNYIFSKDDVLKAIDNEYRTDRKKVLGDLYKEDNFKYYAVINQNIFESLNTLRKTFGNFNEVIDLCIRRLKLFSLASPKVITLPPILLSGEPGVGKTRFLKELAKILGTDLYFLDFSTVSSGFILNGGASSWTDSKPGFLSEKLRASKYANPIILLDEIDKVAGDHRYDPLACLYSLLEGHSAETFRDEYLEIEMNMSKVIWFATANYPEKIAAPIRSRMTEIHIEPPTKEHSLNIVKAIYKELLDTHSWGEYFSTQLASNVIERLVMLPPRLMKKELEQTLANAADRTKSKQGKIKIQLTDLGEISIAKIGARGIGFLAEI
jgi:ATP-dependent Lon protease